MRLNYSDYVIYVDESGDHGLVNINPQYPVFALLRTNADLRKKFYSDLNGTIQAASFTFFASVIQKKKLVQKYVDPFNPYHIALRFCMEKTHEYLLTQGQSDKKVSLVVEGRGRNEDEELELEFYRIIQSEQKWGWKETDFDKIKYTLTIAHKQINSTGLQLADLVARPVALSCLRPDQPNRAMAILKQKMTDGTAIKVFP